MRFVTFFPELKNFHLKKDVGLIPILLNKYKGYDTTIVTYNNDDMYNFNPENVKIEFIEKKFGIIIDFSIYLINNSKKIDILNLYHVTSARNFKWIVVYKFFNKYGKVFLKLDADKNIEIYNYNKCSLKQKVKNYILKKIKLITVENYTIKDYIDNNWDINVELLPNGFYDDDIRVKKNYEKENIILTVGRIGTYQKATEILLESFAKSEEKMKEWKLVIVGEVNQDFYKFLNKYKNKYSHLEERIEFLGQIDDSNKIREYYRKSKIFCLPSRYESFGLVLVEALMEGCYVITSNHESASTIIREDRVGTIFNIDNIDELSNKFINICNSNRFKQENYLYISDYAYKNFYWKEILDNLDNLLRKN